MLLLIIGGVLIGRNRNNEAAFAEETATPIAEVVPATEVVELAPTEIVTSAVETNTPPPVIEDPLPTETAVQPPTPIAIPLIEPNRTGTLRLSSTETGLLNTMQLQIERVPQLPPGFIMNSG